MAPLEADLEAKCVSYARQQYGWMSAKLDRPPNKDWPDRAFFLPGEKVWLVEFKLPGEAPRKRQGVVFARLGALRHVVSVITSFEQFAATAQTRADLLTSPRR